MRFIFNFFFFGILFYVIYLFFPDTFHTLVGWANSAYEFLRDLFMQVAAKFHEWRQSSNHGQYSAFWELFQGVF